MQCYQNWYASHSNIDGFSILRSILLRVSAAQSAGNQHLSARVMSLASILLLITVCQFYRVFKFHPLVCPALQMQWFTASAPTSLLDHKPHGEFKFQMSAFSARCKMLYYRDALALKMKILTNSGKQSYCVLKFHPLSHPSSTTDAVAHCIGGNITFQPQNPWQAQDTLS